MNASLIALLVLAEHISAMAFAPAGAAKFYWSFAANSKSWLTTIDGLPTSGRIVTSLLAGVAALGFIATLLALFEWPVLVQWFAPQINTAAVASILLYILYFHTFFLLPIAPCPIQF